MLAVHGGKGLKELVLPRSSSAWKEIRDRSLNYPEVVLSKRNLCDIELLLNGGFSPLEGFMNKSTYESVVYDMRLPDGVLWPMPINLEIDANKAKELANEEFVSLKDFEGNTVAVMKIEDLWKPDKSIEAEKVFGGDPEHPAIQHLNSSGEYYIGGPLTGLQLPPSYDYKELRITAFQTRNPMHRAHFELTLQALENPDTHLLVHPVVGQTKPGDIDHHTRVKCYREIMPRYPEGRASLAVFPLAMRMGGPREAIWHAIIRKNYGASHFIVGRDHAGPGSNSQGVDFYGPFEARDTAQKYQEELGINLIGFEMVVYVPSEDKFYPIPDVPEGAETMKLSGTEVRRRLATGEDIPEWFSFGEVVKILRQANPPRSKQGVCVFFTGLSGSGKTTIANALQEKLMEASNKSITILDGDHVRQLLSSGLTFSRPDRIMNIKRIGWVASEVVKAGGYVIAAPIAPHAESRNWARQAVEQGGGFMEVHLSTPIETCEVRDRKGLYKKVREGTLKNFTGIDDPYELPENPDLRIDTGSTSIAGAVDMVMDKLKKEGYLE